MKAYPTITGEIVHQPVYAFDKYDGSNVRAEWSRKRGFYKFGKRNHLLDDSCPFLREAEGLILENYSDALSRIFRDDRWDNGVCFFEFFGPNSFAGIHEDEPHEVVLFDVSTQRGILEPRDFLKIFEEKVKIAELLYHGNPNSEFLDSVRNGTLEGMTLEGVVCKGKWMSPGRPLMFKVKNHAWVKRVKERFAGDEKMIEQLL
jgi:hypothetical protein